MTKSLSHIKFAAMGGSGSIAQKKANCLLELFLEYYRSSERYRNDRYVKLMELMQYIESFVKEHRMKSTEEIKQIIMAIGLE